MPIPHTAAELKRHGQKDRLEPLPGTLAEAHAIQRIIPDAELYEGSNATETALKHLHSPRILHIATHGFFRANMSSTDLASNRGLKPDRINTPPVEAASTREDPLLRSGLALACANDPCGEVDDGILTALEATTLDLEGTQLVVLCLRYGPRRHRQR